MMKFTILPRKLKIFDFDDTLVVTDSKIHIVNKGLRLSSLEFAKYKREPNDIIDFTEFSKKELDNPKPTPFFYEVFLQRKIDSDIMILTARRHTDAVVDFLKDFIDISRISIVGNADTPELKKKEIKKVLDKYDSIIFYDDSKANIAAVESLKSPKIKTEIVKK